MVKTYKQNTNEEHKNEFPHNCQICDFYTKYKGSYKRHLKSARHRKNDVNDTSLNDLISVVGNMSISEEKKESKYLSSETELGFLNGLKLDISSKDGMSNSEIAKKLMDRMEHLNL